MNTQAKKQRKYNTFTKYGSYTVLVILIIAFIGAPVVSRNFSTPSVSVFGKYARQEIKYKPNNNFGRAVQNNLYRLEQQYPQAAENQFFISNAWRSGFDQTVTLYALLNLAKSVHYQISQDKIKKIIANAPEFKTEDGEFNRELYNNQSTSFKTNFITTRREYAIATKIESDLTNPSFISSSEIEFYKDINRNRRSFSYVRFDKNKIANKQVLVDFAKDKNNAKLFDFIEYKSVTVADKSEATEIHNKLTNEEITFDEAVTTYSIDSAKDARGNRGSFYAYQISNQEGEDTLHALISLSLERFSDPIELENGNFVIYALASEIVHKNFEDIDINNLNDEQTSLLDEVQNYMNIYQTGIIEDEVQSQADSFISQTKKDNFANVANNKNLELGNIPLSPLNADDISLFDAITSDKGPGIAQLSAEYDILSDIYNLSHIGDISNPYVIGDYIYVFQLKETSDNTTNRSIKEIEANLNYSDSVVNFVKNTNQKNEKNAVVVESKLVDNFALAFSKIYN